MASTSGAGFAPVFNGKDLSGWFAAPRTYDELWPGGPNVLQAYSQFFPADHNEGAAEHPAVWRVEQGAIAGRQDSPGSGWGGYLVSEKKFGDFELMVEAKPDWPADIGIMLRKRAHSFHGLQVLVDHRQSGSIGGFYGNGIGGFHAIPFATDAIYDEAGRAAGLRPDNPATTLEPFNPDKREMLTSGYDVNAFLAAWRFGDWNEFRIRIVGAKPAVTVWINNLEVASINLATLVAPNYDADAVANCLGREGHIAFEVHDNDGILKEKRWGRDAACRWRNVLIKEL
ncbi:MAG: DUF1080 domain-containing protein [Rhodospirillales bacterium]|nr:DUF1080 domain-containing protein [Rhodospirillales bacterium]